MLRGTKVVSMEFLGSTSEPPEGIESLNEIVPPWARPAGGGYSELATMVILQEYAALRAEVVDLARRASQLVQLTVAAAGALLAAGLLGSLRDPDQRTNVTYLLLGIAALLWLVAMVYIGHVNKQMEIGHYIRGQAIVLRSILRESRQEGRAKRGNAVNLRWVLSWEDRTGQAPIGKNMGTILLADALQLTELGVVAAVPMFLSIDGLYFYTTYSIGAVSFPATILLILDVVLILVVITALILSLLAQRIREKSLNVTLTTQALGADQDTDAE